MWRCKPKITTSSSELAKDNPVYQDTASKFFEHFLRIARAMTAEYRGGRSLWDEEDGFFYDVLHLPQRRHRSVESSVPGGADAADRRETLEH